MPAVVALHAFNQTAVGTLLREAQCRASQPRYAQGLRRAAASLASNPRSKWSVPNQRERRDRIETALV